MTVGELIRMLKHFDPEAEVVIGMKQRFGSDFMNEVADVSEEKVDGFWSDEGEAVVITQGEQLGVVRYEDED